MAVAAASAKRLLGICKKSAAASHFFFIAQGPCMSTVQSTDFGSHFLGGNNFTLQISAMEDAFGG